MAKKDSLSDLVRTATTTPAPPLLKSSTPDLQDPKTQRLPNSPSTGVSESETPKVSKSRTRQVSESRSRIPATGIPRYQEFHAKEARLSTTQLDELHRLARQLNQGRTDKTERITENTLIRIAVNLLIEHAGGLRGDTEADLQDALRTHLRR